MRNGDTIRISADGFELRRKAIEPLGVFHNSSCWGVWVAGRPSRNSQSAKQQTTASARPIDHLPHLVVSPIHPDQWPLSAHLETRIRDEPGALARIADVFRDQNVNILFADCAASGYKQANFAAVVELEKFREEFQNDLRNVAPLSTDDMLQTPPKQKANESIIDNRSDQTRKSVFEKMGRKIIGELFRLWSSIRLNEHLLYRKALEQHLNECSQRENQGLPRNELPDFPGDHYFPSRVVQEGCEPWFLRYDDRIADEILKEFSSQTGNRSQKKKTLLQQWFDELSQTQKRSSDKAGIIQTVPTSEAMYFQSLSKSPQMKLPPEKMWGREIIKRLMRRQWTEPVRLQALFTLAYYRMWAHPMYPMVHFTYDANRNLLVPDNSELISRVLSCHRDRKTKSRLAIAAFHRYDRFVRVEFVEENMQKSRLVQIRMKYECSASNKPKPSTGQNVADSSVQISPDGNAITFEMPGSTPRGLLYGITEAARKNNINLINLSNRMESYNPHSRLESGVIEMVAGADIAIVPDVIGADLRLKMIDIAKEIKEQAEAANEAKSTVTCTVDIVAKPFPDLSIFYSRVFGSQRHDELLSLLEQQGELAGFHIRRVEQYTEPVTAKVNDALSHSNGMIQLITLRDSDRHALEHNRDFVPDFWWLMYEYGFASSRGIPIVRLVDRDMPKHIREKYDLINRDVAIVEFRSSFSTERASDVFRKAIDELRARLSPSEEG